MQDPNDFVDDSIPEGEARENPKAGQEGVGGLKTEEAEQSYRQAAKQHFKDDIENQKENKPKKKAEEPKSPTGTSFNSKGKEAAKKASDKNAKTIPQIGSIEDDSSLPENEED